MFSELPKTKQIDALEIALADLRHRSATTLFPTAKIRVAPGINCHLSVTDEGSVQADMMDDQDEEIDGGGECTGLFEAYCAHRKTGKPKATNIRRRLSFLADIITSYA